MKNQLQVVGGALIGCAVYGNRFTDLPIIPSVISCGIVLISLAVFGVFGAMKHHQVILFFYMIILFCLFIVQFAIACSCLAVSKHQQELFAEEAWDTVSNDVKTDIQKTFNCCGFNSTTLDDHPSCDVVNKICCPAGSTPDCTCSPCMEKLEDTINSAFFVSGTIGLIFSFTEVSKVSILNFNGITKLFILILTNNRFKALGSNTNSSLSQPKEPKCISLFVKVKPMKYLK